MQYDDYIILVDENGRPYIAHAEGAGSWKNRAVKYLEKFPNLYRHGKTAYAYTQQQLQAMRNYARTGGRKVKDAAKKAAKFVDDHDAGLTERIQSRSYSRQAKRAAKRGNHDEFNDLATQAAKYAKQSREEYKNSRIKKASDSVKKYGSVSLNAVKKAGGKAAKYIDDHDAGLTERIQARRLSQKSKRASRRGYNDDATEYSLKAAQLRKQSREEYNNSGAKKAIDAAKNKVGGTATAVKNNVSGTVNKATTSVKGAINNARSTVNDVINRKVTGSSAQANISQATQNALMGLDGAIGEYSDAVQAYNNSLKGKNSAKIQRAAQAVADAKSAVSSLLAKAGGVFSKDEKAQIQDAVNYTVDPVTGEWVYKK